jgi:YaiO family outer membrane protein
MNYQFELRSCLLRILPLFCFFCTFYLEAVAQIVINGDSLLIEGNRKINEQEFESGRKDLKVAFKAYPNYQDVVVSIARSFAFENKYDSAEFYINKAKGLNPNNYELRSLDIKINLWQNKHEEVVRKTSAALGIFENDSLFEITKAKSLFELKRYKEALPILEEFKSNHPDNDDIDYLYRLCKIKTMKNQVGVAIGRDIFSNSDFDRSTIQVDWRHERDKIIYNPRFSYANRFNLNSYMGEIDLYPKFGDDFYIFSSIGVSDGILFPQFRISVEPFWAFTKNHELSGGVRYLSFPGNEVYLLTASFTRYQGDWWLHARVYQGIELRGNSYIGELAARRYLKNQFQFAELRVGYGSSPDNFYLASNLDEVLGSRALNFIFTFQQPIKLKWLFRGWVIYDFQQPNELPDFTIFSVNAGLWYRF